MPLSILEAASLKGDGDHNEDIYGMESGFAWVLDGATGVAASSIAAHTSDAGWYVERIDAELRKAIQKQPAIQRQALLQDAVRAVEADYQAAIAIQPEPSFPPSAAFAMLQADDHYIELSGLGDCAALFTTKEGNIGYFESDQRNPIDSHSIQHLIAEQNKAPDTDHKEIVDRITPILQRNRSRMNTPEGYWILSFSQPALDHIHTERITVDPNEPIILMSDGFTRALEMFDAMDEAKLYQTILSNGVSYVGERLRQREADDASCRRYPRFKKSDDATCLVLSMR